MNDRVSGIAEAVGLDYDYEHMHQTNTVKAHELLHYAKAHGKQLELKERLLQAYFLNGEHVGRIPDLADIAAYIGLDREEVAARPRERAVPARREGRHGAGAGLRHQRRAVLRRRRQVRGVRRAGDRDVR